MSKPQTLFTINFSAFTKVNQHLQKIIFGRPKWDIQTLFDNNISAFITFKQHLQKIITLEM